MGRTTQIAWTESTVNFWIGCHHQSPGCDHCYAETLVTNRMGRDFWVVWRTSPTTFSAALRWKEPRRIFTCSLSDFFHPGADAWRDEAWEVIRRTPQHTWQILTKRPQMIKDRLPRTCFDCGGTLNAHDEPRFGERHEFHGWPWPNVWLGVSCENQTWADRRIALLERIPAAKKFLSCEPLLGPIDLGRWIRSIDWVIVGGESGPGFRPMDLDWARKIRDQCEAAEVAFFFKQSSGLRPGTNPVLDGRVWEDFP